MVRKVINSDGSKHLFPDTNLALLVGLLTSQIALGVVEWLGTIDFSTLPTWAATTAALLVSYASAWLTGWAAKAKDRRAVMVADGGTVNR